MKEKLLVIVEPKFTELHATELRMTSQKILAYLEMYPKTKF